MNIGARMLGEEGNSRDDEDCNDADGDKNKYSDQFEPEVVEISKG